ncbi:MAG: hypothetical protein A2031_08080 [Deltaproteobacteria bacterium RBG_19FT_COMBO_43_11]|nr:MAG: hypothetical protein A2031_08080 [Deltaproteobacteria bacterium RBG_19FT_COMBO_43_11]
MNDKERGIYKKYSVKRLGDKEGKHKKCFYFVIDIKHDKFAVPALRAYAKACSLEYPSLAKDLRSIIETMELCEPHKTEILISKLRNIRMLRPAGR